MKPFIMVLLLALLPGCVELAIDAFSLGIAVLDDTFGVPATVDKAEPCSEGDEYCKAHQAAFVNPPLKPGGNPYAE